MSSRIRLQKAETLLQIVSSYMKATWVALTKDLGCT